MQTIAFGITNSITPQLSVVQFKELIDSYIVQGYWWNHGGRCGWNIFGVVAQMGSIQVLKYILTTHPEYVDLGNTFGWTPLFCLCKSSQDENIIYEKAKILLKYGANPDYGVTCSSFSSDEGATETGIKSIDVAKHRGLSKVVALLSNHRNVSKFVKVSHQLSHE